MCCSSCLSSGSAANSGACPPLSHAPPSLIGPKMFLFLDNVTPSLWRMQALLQFTRLAVINMMFLQCDIKNVSSEYYLFIFYFPTLFCSSELCLSLRASFPKAIKAKKFQPWKNDKNNWKYLKLSPLQLWFSPCEAVLKQPILQGKKNQREKIQHVLQSSSLLPFTPLVLLMLLCSLSIFHIFFFFTAASFQLTQSLQLCCTAADRKLHFLQWQRGVKSIWG